jgi:hypothetical protein
MSNDLLDHMPRQEHDILQQRIRLWETYDQAQDHADQIAEMTRGISRTGPAATIPPLSAQGTPPTELAQAVAEAHKELQRIESAQASIRRHQEEIERIKSQQMMMAMGGAAAIVIIILLLLVL